MVSSASAAAQASENEKRRKQTMEKAKANHLSRQLQMRLQYARLKVEHGWQKQNLNEVENLYFHHSHLRGPKPFPAPSIIATQQHLTPFAVTQSAPAQSSLSFKLGASSLVRHSNIPSSLQSHDQSKNHPSHEDVDSSNHASQPVSAVDSPIPTPLVDPLLRPDSSDESPMKVDVQDPTSVSLSLSSPLSKIATGHDSNPTLGDPSIATDISPSPQDSQSPTDHASSSINHYPAVKPPRPRAQKTSSAAKALPPLTAKDMYTFGSSNLTYDSFWSSHTGSTTPRL